MFAFLETETTPLFPAVMFLLSVQGFILVLVLGFVGLVGLVVGVVCLIGLLVLVLKWLIVLL